MDVATHVLDVARGPYRMHAEVTGGMTGGEGTPVVLMHGFPDNLHLYDRLLAHLAGHRPVVRFDFLGWGRSDKPPDYPYTATNQVGDVAAAVDAASAYLAAHQAGQAGQGSQGGQGEQAGQVILVAHDASGPPAIDWALANPGRVAGLVLLNTYYHWTPGLRRPPAIALYSTPLVRAAARALARRRPDLDRRLYTWQVGGFVHDPQVRQAVVTQLYEQFPAARPAFWRLNDDLLGTVLARRRRIGELRRFGPPVRVVFGTNDRYLGPRVARRFAALFPHSELHLLRDAGHYVQVDEPERVAGLILSEWRHATKNGYTS